MTRDYVPNKQPAWKTGMRNASRPLIDMSQVIEVINRIEDLPIRVARDLRDVYLVQAGQILAADLTAKAPVGNDKDRRKQSRTHKRIWKDTKRAKESIDYVVRKFGSLGAGLYAGPTFPDGNKFYFDWYGNKPDRHMYFWTPRQSGGGTVPKTLGRIRKKRDIFREVRDSRQKFVIDMILNGVSRSVQNHMGSNNG